LPDPLEIVIVNNIQEISGKHIRKYLQTAVSAGISRMAGVTVIGSICNLCLGLPGGEAFDGVGIYIG